MNSNTIKRILCAVMAILFAVAAVGCSLNNSSKDKNASIVIAKVGDRKITYGEVDSIYQMYVQQFKAYGYDLESDPETAKMYKAYILNDILESAVLLYQAKEQGFDQLTDEQKKELDEQIASTKEDIYAFYRSTAEEEKAEDVDARVEELIKKEADNYYPGENLTVEQYMEKMAEEVRESFYTSLLEQSVYETLSVSDDEVKAWYDETVAQLEEEYGEDAALFEGDYEEYVKASGMPVVYEPAGYGKVLHILIGPDGDVSDEYAENKQKMESLQKEAGELYLSGENAERLASIKAEYEELSKKVKAEEDAMYTDALKKIQEAYAKLEAGAAFADVMAEYTEDTNFLGETSFAKKGMLIYDDSDVFSDTIKAKYKTLEQGKYSEYFLDEDGYHIIYNLGTSLDGAVDYEAIKEDIHTYLLNEKKAEEWEACVSAWVADKSVTIFADRLNQLGIDMSALEE